MMMVSRVLKNGDDLTFPVTGLLGHTILPQNAHGLGLSCLPAHVHPPRTNEGQTVKRFFFSVNSLK